MYFIEGMPVRNDDGTIVPGPSHPEQWKPYKLWAGDKWQCEGCGSEIIVGAGLKPISIQHEDNFQDMLRAFDPKLQVNDC